MVQIFADPIAAGVVLVRPAMQSGNYLPGQRGWRVGADGTAEFRDLVVPASVIGPIGVLNPNPYFTGGDSSGWVAQNGTLSIVSGAGLPAGAAFPYAAFYTATGATGSHSVNEFNGPFPAQPGQQYLVMCRVYSSQPTVFLGFNWGLDGTGVSSNSTTATVTPNTWTQLTTVLTAPLTGINQGSPFVAVPAAGNTVYVQAVICLPQVPGGLIQAGTITAAQIAAGTIIAGIVDGTTINAATFNGGTYKGTDFLLNTTGGFWYSGTPAAGDLSASIVGGGSTVTDPFGNSAYPGVYSYASASNFAGLASAALILQNGSFPWEINVDPATGFLVLQFSHTGLQLYMPTTGISGALVAQQPGTLSPETWHPITALPTGWTALGAGIRYRLMPDDSVRIQVSASIGATAASGTVPILTLPSGYTPANQFRGCAPGIFTGVSTATGSLLNCRFQVTTGGVVEFLGFPGGSSSGITEIDGQWDIPLD